MAFIAQVCFGKALMGDRFVCYFGVHIWPGATTTYTHILVEKRRSIWIIND
jgi:hypothetical protein